MHALAGLIVRPIGVVAVLACAAVPAGAQQTPPVSRSAGAPASTGGAITGLVISAASGGPVHKAQVTLSWGDKPTTRTAVTDTLGHFEFLDLPAADFSLTASHPGFLDVTYGQRQPGAGG